MCRCTGCGVKLQNIDRDVLGYTSNINNNLCERCFRINNYNEYKTVVKSNQDFINILENINKTNDLVVLVVDLFNINKNLEEISKYVSNDILLVLTKRDILPKSCYDKKLLEYFSDYNLNIIDSIIISSVKNYNFDLLYSKILNNKKSNNVFVVGFTNAGKSTMINKIIYNYSNLNSFITTSNLPSTTIDSIEIKINNDLTIIDTPGLLDNEDIINFVDSNTVKRIIPTKEIKPITYQIKGKQVISIDDLVKIEVEDKNSLTIYVSRMLNINRSYKTLFNVSNLDKKEIDIDDDNDIVIQGLGFIKFTNKAHVNIYVVPGVRVFKRKNLI